MVEGPLSRDELDRVLRGYGVAPDGERGCRVVTARVGHVRGAAFELAIKVFSAEQHAQARAESSLLAALEGHGRGGYRVQRPRRTARGELLLPLDQRRVLVTEWEHGVHRSYREIDAAGWAELGRTLAALHLRLDAAPVLPLPSLVGALRERELDDDRRRLEAHRQRVRGSGRASAQIAHTAQTVQRLLDDRAALLERHGPRARANAPSGDERPIHNDFNVHNYLFHDHGPPTILDWERAVLAPREYEVCRCLNHLPLVAPEHAWAFVRGYLERRSLDPALVAWAFDAAIATHALKHWPVEAWLAGAPGAEEQIAGLAAIARAFVDGGPRLEAFVQALRAQLC